MTMTDSYTYLNIRRSSVRCIMVLSVLLLFLIQTCCSFASGEESILITLQENEWTWEENSAAYFSGTVKADESLPDKILMKLSLSAAPENENAGEVVFQNVNGKKLTIRKQKPEYSVSAEGLKEFDFSGVWNTPDAVKFTRVDILLQIFNAEGSSLLAEQTLTVSRDLADVVEKDDGKIRLKDYFSDWTVYIAAGAAVIWILAVVRAVLNRKKTNKER